MREANHLTVMRKSKQYLTSCRYGEFRVADSYCIKCFAELLPSFLILCIYVCSLPIIFLLHDLELTLSIPQVSFLFRKYFVNAVLYLRAPIAVQCSLFAEIYLNDQQPKYVTNQREYLYRYSHHLVSIILRLLLSKPRIGGYRYSLFFMVFRYFQYG